MPPSPNNGIQVVQDVLGKDEGEGPLASSHRGSSAARKAELVVPGDTLGHKKQTVSRDQMVLGKKLMSRMLMQCPVWEWPSETQKCLRPVIMNTGLCSPHTSRSAFS